MKIYVTRNTSIFFFTAFIYFIKLTLLRYEIYIIHLLMHLLISMFRYRAHIDTPPTSFCVGGGGGGHGIESNGNSQK